MKHYNPWSILVIVHLALLTAVNHWRATAGYEDFAILKGSAPNLLAVPILCFGVFLFVHADKRQPGTDETRRRLNRLFLWSLAGSVTINVVWEFLQITGNLVFDVVDLGFVGLGALLSVALFRLLRGAHFHAGPQAQ